MTLSGGELSGLLKIRGLFRLLRIGILIRKFDAIRRKRAAQRRMQIRDIFHVKAPAEIVNEILCGIRDMIENDDRLLEDINYCIKMVSSGKLYEANFEAQLGSDEKSNEAFKFFQSVHGKEIEEKQTDSIASKQTSLQRLNTIDLEERLNMSESTKIMLESVNSLDFNIFDFKDATVENEMLVLTSHLMHKHNLFKTFKLDPELFIKFITHMQDNYNPSFIEYHNKTHGTDLCQTVNYFINGCDLQNICCITELELGAIYIAGACHDFEHPGLNNLFLVESRLPWAIEYNDKSPLENHHIAATFGTIQKEEYKPIVIQESN